MEIQCQSIQMSIDTLRQLISQSIPQLISSCMTIVTTFVSMIILNIPLTVLSVCMLMIMLCCIKKNLDRYSV